MCKATCLVAITVWGAVTSRGLAAPVQWTVDQGGNGHYYQVAKIAGSAVTWDAARDQAVATTFRDKSGHLATITSAAENAFITQLLLPYDVGIRYAWLGGYQTDPSNSPADGWRWVTGEPWSYTNWAAGEPDDNGGAQESWLTICGTLLPDRIGKWSDYNRVLEQGWYVVEFDIVLPPCPITLYVDSSAHGANNGRTWTDAYGDLQAALDEAARLENASVQLWVAKGHYVPSKAVVPEDRRTMTFQMTNNLPLYGGFAGGETSLTQRKPFENLTILSGDLDNDDAPPVLHPYGPELRLNGANSYWVVGGANLDSSALLDGFVVENGSNACYGGPDCGYTGGSGGGVFIKTGSPRIANCTIMQNLGSGVSLAPGASPTFVNCRFLGNRWAGLAGYGSYPTLINCIFTGHTDAIFIDYSRPTLVNCTITGNEQGILLDGGASIDVYNSIIWDNLAQQYPSVADKVYYSCVQPDLLAGTGTGNVSVDPQFINPMGPDHVYGTLDDNVRLTVNSPCVDTGNNWYLAEAQDVADLDGDGVTAEELPLDLGLQPRRADTRSKPDGTPGTPPIVDMGAYEHSAQITPGRLYVKSSPEGANDGTSWQDAFWNLQSALDVAEQSNGAITEIWLGGGSYWPTKRTASNDPRSATFRLVSGVTIYGGFAGWETSIDQRDVSDFMSELTGDLGDGASTQPLFDLARCVSRNDSPLPLGPGCEAFDYDGDKDVDGDDIAKFMKSPGRNDNAYHVVTAVNTGPGTALDGVSITGGVGGEGAGIWADQSTLALRRCVIFCNLATYSGAGIGRRGGALTLTDCYFSGNSAGYEGGGLNTYEGTVAATRCRFVENGAVSGGSGVNLFRTPTTLTQCELVSNVAGYSGAGVRQFDGPLTIEDCLFSHNVAGYSGAGIDTHSTTLEVTGSTFTSNRARNGGGINANGGGETINRELRVTNCTFTGNSAEYAGGAMNLYRTGRRVANCAFVDNRSSYSGGAIDEFETSPAMINCTFIGNTASFGSAIKNFRSSPALTNCLVWNNTARSIVDEDSGQSVITYSDLQEPVPGAGNFSEDPKLRTDAPGDVRLAEGSPCIDAGNNAVAIGPDLAGRARLLDDLFTSDTGTGTPPIVDIGAYEYYPDCNRNDVDDGADIASGASKDCNANGKPDECEPDCNQNGIADACDITSGTSQDCDRNAVPDECDPDCDGNGVPDGCEMGVGNFRMLLFHLDPQIIDPSRNGTIDQPVFSQTPAMEAVVQWPSTCINPGSAVQGANLTLFPHPESPWTSYDGGPFMTGPADLFGVELRAMLLVTQAQAGPITFEFGADDLALLRIDGQEAYSAFWHQTQTVIWTLAPGSHELLFRMAEFGGGADIRLGWDADQKGGPRVCIPSSAISLTVDCNHNGKPDACDLSDGTSKDCNQNGSPDECDISTGIEKDCNHNGRPDSCDTDADGNGVPDDCEFVQGTLFVNINAQGVGHGRDWGNALTNLQTALDLARASEGAVKQIWVAKGTYRPSRGFDQGDPRSATFSPINGVNLYGGFAGTEKSIAERNLTANITILDGDLIANDGPAFANRADNVYHVVSVTELVTPVSVDGFTIRGGNASGPGEVTPHNSGGGLYVVDRQQSLIELVIANCTFKDNRAAVAGAGAYLADTAARLVNCRFVANQADVGGGGVYVDHGFPQLANCVFSGNFAHEYAAALYSYDSVPTLANCTIVGNKSVEYFAGVYSVDGAVKVKNCIIWGNSSRDTDTDPERDQVWSDHAQIYIDNCCVMNWTNRLGGQGNFGTDPLLVDPAGPDGIEATGDEDLHLRPGSPCIDAGNNAEVLLDAADLDHDGEVGGPTPFDLDGGIRFVDDPNKPDAGSGTPPIVDMGAYERQQASFPIIYVNPTATGAKNGTSWADAFTDLAPAIDAFMARSADTPVQIWVAKGTYRPTLRISPSTPRSATFLIMRNLGLYGGFAGGEQRLEDRNPATNVTILSGDLKGDDGPQFLNRGDNCYHVVVGMSTGPVAAVDGFVITGGFANFDEQSFGVWNAHGAGLHLADFNKAKPGTGTLRVVNCTFQANKSLEDGGAVFSGAAAPTLVKCLFIDNISDDNGGAIVATGGSLTLLNCRFLGNKAGWDGGALYAFEGGSVQMGNCLFSGNYANNDGGAIYNESADMYMVNCTLGHNVAKVEAGGVHDTNGVATLNNCILWGNRSDEGSDEAQQIVGQRDGTGFHYSCVQGWTGRYGGIGNLGVDPKWVDADGPDNVAGTPDDNLRLERQSPYVNAGENSLVLLDIADLDNDGNLPELTPLDLDGLPRFVNTLEECSGLPVDMGAYELQTETHVDCNDNCVPDALDLARGTSQDRNENGTPDECEGSICAATRMLPASYAPGVSLSVTIAVAPASNVAVYAVEDRPPTGWAVGAVNEGGSYDAAMGKVKWGPYLDNATRTLSYQVTPPLTAQGDQCFGPGTISMDGHPTEICGQRCVSPCFDHPADTNADRQLVIDEVTAYAAAWKLGVSWPTPPNPIPISFVTRAGALWKHGEAYCCDSRQAAPMLWVNCAAPNSQSPTPTGQSFAAKATRSFSPGDSSHLVTISISAGGAAAYAVEEVPPADWLVHSISENGALDPITHHIRWGPFYDGVDRELTYRVTPSDERLWRLFDGKASFDGAVIDIEGVSSPLYWADTDRDSDVDVDDGRLFETCLSGSAIQWTQIECSRLDIDEDGDVDQSDFGVFQRCLTGKGKPIDPHCTD